MRFLILSQYFHPEIGACQIRLAAVTKELLRHGHTVEIVTALPNYPEGRIFNEYRGRFYQTEEWEGMRIHRVWVYAAMGAGISRLFNYLSFMFTAGWGMRRADKPDYIFVESPPLFLAMTAWWFARRWRVPLILNVADLWPDLVQEGLLRKKFVFRFAEKLAAWAYRQANYINTLTEDVRTILIEEKHVPAAKVLLLPNAADTQLFAPQPADEAWRTQLGFSGKHLFLYAGTQGYVHGVEVILQAAALLSDTNILFLIVGGGSDKPRLEQLKAQMQLPNVIFWSPQSPVTITRLYSLAIAGISTIRDTTALESVRPAKVLSIMSCGKPVLYSGTGEGARLVTTAQAGIVIPPQDPRALAAAARQLIENSELAQQLGKNGRQYIETHLQWSQVVTKWLRHLSDLSEPSNLSP